MSVSLGMSASLKKSFSKPIVKGPETLIVSVPVLSIVTRWVRCGRPFSFASHASMVTSGICRSTLNVRAILTFPWD